MLPDFPAITEAKLMRRASILSSLTLALGLALAGTAAADTTLGSTAIPSGSSPGLGCGINQAIAQFTDNPSTPYFVPGAGKITQWQINTTTATPGGSVTFVVLKPASGGSFTVVGADARTLPSPLPSGNVATFPLAAPIAVTAGNTLGLYTGAAVCYWHGGSVPAASTLVALDEPTPPAPNQTLAQRSSDPISPASYTMNVAATFVSNPAPAPASTKKCKKKKKNHSASSAKKKKCKKKKHH
jgi:hypothetical protein